MEYLVGLLCVLCLLMARKLDKLGDEVKSLKDLLDDYGIF